MEKSQQRQRLVWASVPALQQPCVHSPSPALLLPQTISRELRRQGQGFLALTLRERLKFVLRVGVRIRWLPLDEPALYGTQRSTSPQIEGTHARHQWA
jgi:hypothetical protein